MSPKHKIHGTKPPAKRKELSPPSTAIPSAVHSQRKCKKELLFRDDVDDGTPIGHLLHRSSPALTPKTPKRHEPASDAARADTLHLPKDTPAKASCKTRPKKHQHKSRRQTVPAESTPSRSSGVHSTQHVSASQQFKLFSEMTQENTLYSVQVKIVHYWATTISPIETSLSGFLVMKDSQGSLMQAFIPEFLVACYQNKFVRGMSFEIYGAMLYRSTRRTKLVDSLYELHFIETTSAIQLKDLRIDLGPLFCFEDLAKIPNFLPLADIATSQLSVKDIICIVVDLTPLLKRFRRGKIIKFVEAYVTDPTIWPSCCLLTIWEDTAHKFGQQFLRGFTEQFVLIAQHVRPNCYKGKYGYQTNSFTLLSCNPERVEAANSLLDRLAAISSTPATIFQHPNEKTWFRKEPLTLHTISALKTDTLKCPPPGQDKQFIIAATVLRVWNDTSLTYRCCPLCWAAMHESTSSSGGCSKQGCLNKEGRSIHCYRAKIVVLDNTGRATLTLFDQASEELFNTSSDDINHFKAEEAGDSIIASILNGVIDKQFLFYIRVTSANYRYISPMYSSGYTAELVDWIPKLYKPPTLPNPLSLPLLPTTSTSQPSLKGKQLADRSTSSAGTNSSSSPSTTSV